MKELLERLKEKLEHGGSYAEGEAIGIVLSMIVCFLFIMGMLFIFN